MTETVCPACGYPKYGSTCLKHASLTGCLLEARWETVMDPTPRPSHYQRKPVDKPST